MESIENILYMMRKRIDNLSNALNDLGYHNIIRKSEENNESNNKIRNIDYDINIYNALAKLNKALADSYLQIKIDIHENSRISWAGVAHEMREILSTMLRILASEEDIIKQNWYKQETGSNGPTQKQRVLYILKVRNTGSKEQEVVKQVVDLEEFISSLARSIYSRASDAAHRFKTRDEINRLVRYFESFAHDLLDV